MKLHKSIFDTDVILGRKYMRKKSREAHHDDDVKKTLSKNIAMSANLHENNNTDSDHKE